MDNFQFELWPSRYDWYHKSTSLMLSTRMQTFAQKMEVIFKEIYVQLTSLLTCEPSEAESNLSPLKPQG